MYKSGQEYKYFEGSIDSYELHEISVVAISFEQLSF